MAKRSKWEQKNLDGAKARYKEMRKAGFVRVGYWIDPLDKKTVDYEVLPYTKDIVDARMVLKRKK